MFITAVIAFREFFEAFLIIGLFLGISRKLKLKKEKEILIASLVGILFCFFITVGTYLLAEHARYNLTENNADALESYLLIFSGFFIGYVALSLHKTVGKHSKHIIDSANKKMEKKVFDTSIFLIIVFMILREGFELALFTASTSLFSSFIANMEGLLLGFLLSSSIGIAIYFAYTKISVGKIFKVTEYMIILLGASLLQNGITKLFATHFSIKLSEILPVPLPFLPNPDSMMGSFFQNFFGVDRQFSISRLCIMAAYIAVVYFFYMRQQHHKARIKTTQ